jgi:CheY-like chemotaxis protein
MGKMLPRLIGEHIEYSFAPDPKLASVKADPGQIEQVILNLAANARDAMPKGGKLSVLTGNVLVDEMEAAKRPPMTPGRYFLLSASDTGHGMDVATIAHIFEPFFTTKEIGKGTGLGLATVYGVVKQSGGYIDIDSAPGAGATFRIYLPGVDETIKSEKLTDSKANSFSGNETILLAEDEESLRRLTRNTLEFCGYKVLEAKDGVEALEVSDRHAGPIDLLLTDIMMPEMGGRALAQELLRRRPNVRLVYMSGYTGEAVGTRGSVDAGSFFLPKPFMRETLKSKIREALDRRVLVESKYVPK